MLSVFDDARNPETRPKLANHVWVTLLKTIPVVLHFRDLGAHASSGVRLFGGTLNDRIAAATAFAGKLDKFNWDFDTKQAVVRTLVLATGLLLVSALAEFLTNSLSYSKRMYFRRRHSIHHF